MFRLRASCRLFHCGSSYKDCFDSGPKTPSSVLMKPMFPMISGDHVKLFGWRFTSETHLERTSQCNVQSRMLEAIVPDSTTNSVSEHVHCTLLHTTRGMRSMRRNVWDLGTVLVDILENLFACVCFRYCSTVGCGVLEAPFRMHSSHEPCRN